MKKVRPADIYLRFLQLTEAIRGLPTLPELDPLEERILTIVARAQFVLGHHVAHGQALLLLLGAPATVHARLKSMREKGWIMLSDTADARRKQIELTQAALQHFDRLSQCMLRATDGKA